MARKETDFGRIQTKVNKNVSLKAQATQSKAANGTPWNGHCREGSSPDYRELLQRSKTPGRGLHRHLRPRQHTRERQEALSVTPGRGMESRDQLTPTRTATNRTKCWRDAGQTLHAVATGMTGPPTCRCTEKGTSHILTVSLPPHRWARRGQLCIYGRHSR